MATLHTEINGKIINEKYPSLAGNYGGFYNDLYNTIVKKEPLKVKPEHGYNTIRSDRTRYGEQSKEMPHPVYEFDGCRLSLNDQQTATAYITIIHSS